MEESQQGKNNQEQIKQFNNFLLNYFKLVILLVVVAILAGGYFFVLAPKYHKISIGLAEAARVQSEKYEREREYLDKLLKLNERFNTLNDDNLKKIDIILPSQPESEKLFSQLEILANQNGVFLASLKIETEESARSDQNGSVKEAKAAIVPGVSSLRISMKLVGVNYDSFKNVLRDLEKNMRVVNVDEIAFSPKNNSAEFSMSAYYLQAQASSDIKSTKSLIRKSNDNSQEDR